MTIARGRNVLVSLATIAIDVRYALRHLRRHPWFTLTAILTLAIGIGANTAIFTLLHGVRWRAIPASSPHELVTIGFSRTDDDAPGPFPTSTYAFVQQLRTQTHLFADASAWRHELTPVVEPDGTIRTRRIGLVSGNGFEMLGVRPHLGRLLTPADDRPGGPDGDWPVVLGYRFWREQFAGDPRVIGASITVHGTITRIVGVAPRSFPGPWTGIDVAVYLPFRFAGVLFNRGFDNRGHFFLADSLARVRPGVSLAQLDAQKERLEELLFETFNGITGAEPREQFFRRVVVSIDPAATGLPTEFRFYDVILFGLQLLTGVALCLCCVTVSGLMHARLDDRHHEFASRRALGATRMRLARHVLIEAFTIAIASAAIGSVIAWHGSRLLLPFFPNAWPGATIVTYRVDGMAIEPDSTVVLAAAITAVLVTLLMGARPAWRASRIDGPTHAHARRPFGRIVARTVGRIFVALQLALALVVVAFATVKVFALLLYRGQDLGFDADRVTFQTPSFLLVPQKGGAKLDLYQRLVDRIAQAPGVTAAAVTSEVPLIGDTSAERPGPIADNPATGDTTVLAEATVGPGYFRTMGMTLVAGREFERDERTPNVCVLNQGAASFLFPRQSAVGRDLATSESRFATHRVSPRTTGESYTCRVVGVVNDARDVSLHDPISKTIYYPVTPPTHPVAQYNLVLLINATSKAAAIAAYRQARTEVAPTLPITPFATLREQLDATIDHQRAITWLAVFGGGVSLLLAAIAISKPDSHADRRTPEVDGRQR